MRNLHAGHQSPKSSSPAVVRKFQGNYVDTGWNVWPMNVHSLNINNSQGFSDFAAAIAATFTTAATLLPVNTLLSMVLY